MEGGLFQKVYHYLTNYTPSEGMPELDITPEEMQEVMDIKVTI